MNNAIFVSRFASVSRECSRLGVLCLGMLLLMGCNRENREQVDLSQKSWPAIEDLARSQTVRMAMWDGDPLINAYMRQYVQPKINSDFDIRLEFIGLRGNPLVNKLLVELDAGRETGDIDLMWINGETFYQLRQIKALYGPFTDQLPNSALIDWDNKFIAYDFQQPIEGMECPWGNVQFTMIYDPERVAEPPLTPEQLAIWIKAHPGRFTFDNSFTGLTFLKSLLVHFAGGSGSLAGEFDEAKYDLAAAKLWSYIADIRPFLWREGTTFPNDVSELHRLFANNEVDFAMSNNDGEVDNKVKQGILPDTALGYVFETGTIRNSHYLGIPVNAPNKAAAMVLVNFLISPAAQYQKIKPSVWGDGTVLEMNKLSPEWRKVFEEIPSRQRVPTRAELTEHALMEPAPEITLRLYNDFQKLITESDE